MASETAREGEPSNGNLGSGEDTHEGGEMRSGGGTRVDWARRGGVAATLAAIVLVAHAIAGYACGASSDGPGGGATPVEPPAPVEPRLPRTAGGFGPSMATLVEGDPADIEVLADVETCEGCHGDAYRMWRSSAHARSSFDNPWYRAAVDAIRDDVGIEESRFCAGCHDPLLLVSGRIDSEVAPDDPLAHAGVTCMVCHGVQETTSDGNASFALSTARVPLPRRGDADSLAAHIEHMQTDPLRTPALCATCHRGFLSEAMGNPHFLPGMDDGGPWRGSVYAGSEAQLLDEPVERSTCQGCHMSLVDSSHDQAATDGQLHSHRFAGGQTSMAAQLDDPEHLAAVVAMLERAPTIDVAAVRLPDGSLVSPADGAAARPGDSVEIDVVVRNAGAGHRFPGGVRDTQDTWIELVIRDARDHVVAEAGTRYEDAADETAHRLITVMLDEQGHPELRHFVHLFEGAGYDHTIGPRDAAAVRYAVVLPETAVAPFRIEARLRHRRHVREMHDAACVATRSERGQAFIAAAGLLRRPSVDGCVPQPVTDLASAAVHVGPGSDGLAGSGDATRPAWKRLFEHALALSHGTQERLDETRPGLERALELLDPEESPRERAIVLAVLATVEGRQGRLADALERATEAEALVGEHPALHRARGDAYAQVWRWSEATDAYARTAELSPGDSAAWRALARAAGSSRQDDRALTAAVTGLALLPRDDGMLRSQALALRTIRPELARSALDAWLLFRRPDHEADLRMICGDEVAFCDRDRQPVPTIEMRAR